MLQGEREHHFFKSVLGWTKTKTKKSREQLGGNYAEVSTVQE